MAWTERYVTASAGGGGDGSSGNPWTLAEAIAAAAAGDRVNIKAGTYANTTTSRAFSVTGTTTAPVWWRGYNTAIGDRDSNPALTPPAITFTTGLCTFGGTHQIFSHLDISGANTARQLNISGANLKVDRCRVENTNAASGSIAALSNTSGTNVVSRSWFKATSTATRVFQNAVALDLVGCVFTGGGAGVDSTVAIRMLGCVFMATGSHGFHAITTGSVSEIISCTFRGIGGDAIRLDVIPSSFITIANCLFASVTGTAINNNSGANTNVVFRMGNDFYSCGANEAGFGDSPSLAELTESSEPHTSSTNLSLVNGASARAGGQPGLFENETYTSYLDVGAVQRQERTAPAARTLMIGSGAFSA
jgi:hypothetical protein